jgi:hypothetical protein
MVAPLATRLPVSNSGSAPGWKLWTMGVGAARACPTLRRKLAILRHSACEAHGRGSTIEMVEYCGGCKSRRILTYRVREDIQRLVLLNR